MSNMTAANSGA